MKIIKPLLSSLFVRFAYKKLNKNLEKKALLSFIVHPLYFRSNKHPNQLELYSIIEVLTKLGYAVTVVDYRRKKISGNYDLAVGFGDCFEFAMERKLASKYILYSTGSPVFIQNQMAIETVLRAKSSPMFSGVDNSELIKCIRLTESMWPNQLVKSDRIISIGNNYTKSLFERFHDKVYSVNGMCFDLNLDFDECLNKNIIETKSIAWFGGKGCLHKGLDLCIQSVLGTDWKLYIIGPLDDEIAMFEYYVRKFPNNILYLGFMSISSQEFKDLMLKIPFSILPSCSEGMATSIVTLAYNFGTIPIITKQCGIDFDENIIEIESLTLQATQSAIQKASELSIEAIVLKRDRLRNKFRKDNNQIKFVKDFSIAIEDIEGVM